jgi:hypothetical protein
MKIFEEIKQYLPKYLSADATQNLFQSLKDFPDNIYDRLYTNILDNENDVFQGDGLSGMLVIQLPNRSIVEGPVMVISNTCDTSKSNQRFTSPKLLYCPILTLSNYIKILNEEGVEENVISSKIEAIKKQYISAIFYLPKAANLPDECIVLLDQVNNCDITHLDLDRNPNNVKEKRLFSLSNYGFYLFLFKLSIHFTRIREAVERG